MIRVVSGLLIVISLIFFVPFEAKSVVQISSSTGLPGTVTAGVTVTQSPFTSSTVTSVAHGLGTVPSFFYTYVECLTAELGYSIGDRLPFNFGWAGGTAAGWFVEIDATNVRILTGSAGLIGINRTTPNAAITLTAANWKIVVVPFKLN